MKDVMTYQEVAAELQVSHWTVRDLVRRRKLRCKRIGYRTRRITREALTAYLNPISPHGAGC